MWLIRQLTHSHEASFSPLPLCFPGPLNFHLHITALMKLLSAVEEMAKQVRANEQETDSKQATEASDMSATEIS